MAHYRVALVASSYHPYRGGVEEHVRGLAARLHERGHDVVVWTVDRGEHLGAQQVDGVEVRYLPTPLPARSASGLLGFAARAPRAATAWWRAYAQFRPEVLNVQCFGPNGLYAAALARSTGTPLLVSSHGETFADDHAVFDRSALLRGGLERALRAAAVVTGCSEPVLEDLATRFGLEEGTVVPNAIDPAAGRIRRPVAPPLVLALGRVEPTKGFDLLLDAFAATAGLDGATLVVGGDGQARADLQRTVRARGLGERVRLPGWLAREEVRAHLSRASVVVVPSRREAFGMVVLEAWDAGVPVVVTNRDGPARLVSHGVNGLVVDPEDPVALGGAISSILADATLAERLAAGGRRAVAEFGWSRVLALYEAAYATCLGR